MHYIQCAWRLLDYEPRPPREELEIALATVSGQPRTSHTVTECVGLYRERYDENEAEANVLRLARAPIRLAAAGKPETGPRFRSRYERRTAEALARLGIRWDYEPDVFHWRDYRNMIHRYTPDFRLLDFANTYVEVKGPGGPSADAQIKMQRVLYAYPNLTLLLWDAKIVEYLEDISDPTLVLGLLQSTSLAA